MQYLPNLASDNSVNCHENISQIHQSQMLESESSQSKNACPWHVQVHKKSEFEYPNSSK